MKILMVNRYGYSEYGCENYFLNLCRLLKDKGHKVIVFTTKDKRNVDKEYADCCVDKMDMGNLGSISLLNKILYAPKTIYSFEARRKIERLIRDTKPDIVHIHNIKRLISSSIIHSIKKFDIPLVYTLHDYHLICPNYRLFSKGKICEKCKDNKYYNAVFNNCIRNSFVLSSLAGIEHYIHTALNLFRGNIDMFIAPSIFIRQKMIEYGFDAQKITHMPYFIFTDDYYPKYKSDNYIVFFGRLIKEKGIITLIRSMRGLSALKLLVIGDGSERNNLEKLVIEEGIDNVEFKGYLPKEDIKVIIEKAMFVVIPSEWYEVFGLVIAESFAMGKPVIGSRIGGIAEIIDDGINGLLFNARDIDELREKIKYLSSHKDKILEMGNNGRQKVVEQYSPGIVYGKILKVYQDLIKKR